MKKSKSNIYKLTAGNNHMGNFTENRMEKDSPLEPSNTTISNKDK